MNRSIHEALHKLFSNDLPHEQLLRMIELNISVFKNPFIHELLKVLNWEEEDIYLPHVRDDRGRLETTYEYSKKRYRHHKHKKRHRDELLDDNL